MIQRAHRIVRLQNLPILVNQVADASCIAGCGVITGAVGKTHGAVGVAEQREGKSELLRKRGIFGYRVKADAKNFYVARAKLIDLIAEPATFSRSPWGVGLGIKPQQYFLALELSEGKGFALMRLYGEVWSSIARL